MERDNDAIPSLVDAVVGEMQPAVERERRCRRHAPGRLAEPAFKGGSADIGWDRPDNRAPSVRAMPSMRTANPAFNGCVSVSGRSRRPCSPSLAAGIPNPAAPRLSTRAGPECASQSRPSPGVGPHNPGRIRRLTHRCSIELLRMDYADALAGMRVHVRGTVQQTGMQVRPVLFGLLDSG